MTDWKRDKSSRENMLRQREENRRRSILIAILSWIAAAGIVALFIMLAFWI
jgi:hypothetical protein